MRAEGYYKILVRARPDTTPKRHHIDTWFIGYYSMNDNHWLTCGRTGVLYDKDLVKVEEERILMPNEESQ